MKKFLLILLIVIILLGGGFSYLYFNPQLPLSQKVLSMIGIATSAGEVAQIANPASVFCEQNSGTLEIITDLSGGQSGLCHLPDGNTCDEWAYFRGECPVVIEANTGVENTGSIIEEMDTTLIPYNNEEVGFSFNYPKGRKIEEFLTIDNDNIEDGGPETGEPVKIDLGDMSKEYKIIKYIKDNGMTEITKNQKINGHMIASYLGYDVRGGGISRTIRFMQNSKMIKIRKGIEVDKYGLNRETLEPIILDIDSGNYKYQSKYPELYKEMLLFKGIIDSLNFK